MVTSLEPRERNGELVPPEKAVYQLLAQFMETSLKPHERSSWKV